MFDALELIKVLEKKDVVSVFDNNSILTEVKNEENFRQAHELNKELRSEAARLIKDDGRGELVELYKHTLLFAAPYDFDSYCRYLEFDRPMQKKFYEPRRSVLKVLVDDLQDLYDGKLDFLGISLPPRIGKALADDTPVWTINGWKKHGDLKPGDYVVSPKGHFVKVLAVHPPCEMEYRVTFSNGESIVCHGAHEWEVYDLKYRRTRIMETYKIADGNKDFKARFLIKKRNCKKSSIYEYIYFSKVTKLKNKHILGRCVTVDGGMYLVGETFIPTHNSTLCIFFITWVIGNRPDVANVMSGHSDKLTNGFYNEVLSIITDRETYLWHDVFPNVHLVNTSAKNESLDLNRIKRFPTFTARSIGGTLTGAVEIGTGGVLYVDDLVEDLEESLNPERMQNKYDAYLNQLKDRKKDGALELMVGTRWNVFDPLGRIQEQYRGNPRYRFRVIPALNENGESNFNYPYKLGFSTEYYRDMKESIDDATWCAKYMGDPYIREGLLFQRESLRRYYELPDGEPDAIWAICDPAQGGGDDTFLPVFYQYGNDHYLVDCVCSDALPAATDEMCANILLKHKVRQCQYENNAAGSRTADKVQAKLKSKGGITRITKKHTQANKGAKILSNSPFVISRILFKDDKVIEKRSDYEKMMRLLCNYTITGKNKHDDVPDGLAQYAEFVIDFAGNKVTIKERSVF